jgi:hypothetical protein
MQSDAAAPIKLDIQIPANGYADDMVLIGNSHAEAQQILTMLERFLAYYGMELNPAKCGYQYRTENPLYHPPPATCRWGTLPILHGKKSYKYLGFHINMYLHFKYQYNNLVAKLDEACTSYYSRQSMSLKEAVTYVNSI